MKKEDTWRLVPMYVDPVTGHLEKIPGDKLVDSICNHKPGDIDYSEIQFLNTKVKQQILYYIATGQVEEDNSEDNVALSIAKMILIDRRTDPNFVPTSLNPNIWIW